MSDDDFGGWVELREPEVDSGEPAGPQPVVAVVGRPNVGKSTLVNRIIGRRQAVVEDIPGVTRDRVPYDAQWNGRSFTVVDTGGWEPDAKDRAAAIAAQAETAVATADVVLFVVDAMVGATDVDEAAVKMLRRSAKPVILIANKADNTTIEMEATSLWSLGLGEPFPVSALHGRGSGDLLDAILDALPEAPKIVENRPRGPRRVGHALGDRDGRAQPARGHAGAAMPEAGTLQVGAGRADAPAGRGVEIHRPAFDRGHAHRLPARIGNGEAGLAHVHQHQLPRIALARGQQRGIDEARARTPGLASGQARPAGTFAHHHGRLRAFGRPHRQQGARPRGWRAEFGQDRQRVVMRLEHLGQGQVLGAQRREGAPAGQRVALPRQRQRRLVQARARACLQR